jgi:hypothetical protein
MKAIISQKQGSLSGPFIEVERKDIRIMAKKDNVFLVKFTWQTPPVDWINTCDLMYCRQHDDFADLKVIRKATEKERKRFRVPLWIQGENIPKCCGRPMHFIDQIDEPELCTEAPPSAKYWWHDMASFYVFTCGQCLSVKAVGQQY